jgi:hypothetical protein
MSLQFTNTRYPNKNRANEDLSEGPMHTGWLLSAQRLADSFALALVREGHERSGVLSYGRSSASSSAVHGLERFALQSKAGRSEESESIEAVCLCAHHCRHAKKKRRFKLARAAASFCVYNVRLSHK